ncbi:MAG: hypothetical protein Q4C91_07375 [Eubacteriales bacterium]|nr:hypothetical protein [Eubacteriales bacterium]
MEEKKQKVVLDGNAFYEIDLECVRKKQKERQTPQKKNQQKGQRN